ncbi:hypothetical protein ACFL5H_03390, partial [Candidatus Latescibacterota bacterium]
GSTNEFNEISPNRYDFHCTNFLLEGLAIHGSDYYKEHMYPYKLFLFIDDLTEYDVDKKFLFSVLKKYCIDLEMANQEHVFKRIKDKHFVTNADFEKDYGIKYYTENHEFKKIINGFRCFCDLFWMRENTNENLLNPQNGNLDNLNIFPGAIPEHVPPEYLKLKKALLEYRLGERLPETVKDIPRDSKDLLDLLSDMNLGEKEESNDISSSTEEDLLKKYYRELLTKTGGNKTKAGELAGLQPKQIYHKLKKLDIK